MSAVQRRRPFGENVPLSQLKLFLKSGGVALLHIFRKPEERSWLLCRILSVLPVGRAGGRSFG